MRSRRGKNFLLGGIALATLALGTTAVIAQATPQQNWEFQMYIQGEMLTNSPAAYGQEYRNTSNNSDPFKVSIVASGEGTGSTYNWFLADESFRQASSYVMTRTGYGDYFGPAWSNSSYQNVHLMGINTGWNPNSIWVDGWWISNVY